MTLEQAKMLSSERKRDYVFNEITGQLIVLLAHGRALTLIHGDSNRPEILCQLLFDAEGIKDSWNLIDNDVGEKRFIRYWNKRQC